MQQGNPRNVPWWLAILGMVLAAAGSYYGVNNANTLATLAGVGPAPVSTDMVACEWNFCWGFYCPEYAICGQDQAGFTIVVEGEPGQYIFQVTTNDPRFLQLAYVYVDETGVGQTTICRSGTGPYSAQPLCDGWKWRQACCGENCPGPDVRYCD